MARANFKSANTATKSRTVRLGFIGFGRSWRKRSGYTGKTCTQSEPPISILPAPARPISGVAANGLSQGVPSRSPDPLQFMFPKILCAGWIHIQFLISKGGEYHEKHY